MKKRKKVPYKKILAAFAALILLTAIALTNTKSRFFARTGQHKIDFSELSGDYDPNDLSAIFEGKSIALASNDAFTEDPQIVLGEATGTDKRIEVDITNQRLYAYEGDKKVFDFVISTGKTLTPTLTGEFRPWIKLRSTKMEGVSSTGYYYLPNVPYVMYFENDKVPGWKGYGIHGTYWHDNFGVPMSNGCVNLKIPDAEKLFYWIEPDLEGHRNVKVTSHNPGTRIIIYGQTPAS